MPGYRLYFLKENGSIREALDLDVADDAAALAKARDLHHGYSIEVWCGKRKVGIVSHERG